MENQKDGNAKRKFLFVLNPVSGNFSKSGLKGWLSAYAEKTKNRFEFHETTGKVDDLQLLISKVEQVNPDVIIAVGGDGTANLVARVAREKNIKMGLMPMGSANGLATELGIPPGEEDALDVILEGSDRKIDMLMINHELWSVHLSDMGLNARVIKRFDKAKIRGFIGYAGQYFKELFNVGVSKFRLVANGKSYKTKAIMVVIANASKYGSGAIINPPGKPDDGVFEVIFIKPYPSWYIFVLAVSFFTGTFHKKRYVRHFSCSKAILFNYGNEEMQIDGEPVGNPGKVEIEIAPSSLTVIVPAKL